MLKLSRAEYAALYGPTTGDFIHFGGYLASGGEHPSNFFGVHVERDLLVHGEELTVSLGGVVRAGLGQSNQSSESGCADTVIANVILLDHQMVVKADLAIREGRISGIGKAGNPNTQPSVTPGMIIGPGTRVINGAGMVVTPGIVDPLVLDCSPGILAYGLNNGVTTVIAHCTGMSPRGRGLGAFDGPAGIRNTLQALDDSPVNVALLGQGCAIFPAPLEEQIAAGAAGLCLSPIRGVYPATIDNALQVADRYDIQVVLHGDPLNEAANFDDYLAAFDKRTVVLLDPGGGFAGNPASLEAVTETNVLAVSASFTRLAALGNEEYSSDLGPSLDHLAKVVAEAYGDTGSSHGVFRFPIAKLALRGEDELVSSGTIPMVGSGHGFAAPGNQLYQTLLTLHAHLYDPYSVGMGAVNINREIKNAIAQVTINPAIAFGLAHETGSIEVGKKADLVFWPCASVGVEPIDVMAGGQFISTSSGNGRNALSNASGLRFVDRSAIETVKHYGLSSRVSPITSTRKLARDDLTSNNSTLSVQYDPESQTVLLDGRPPYEPRVTQMPSYPDEGGIVTVKGDILLNAGQPTREISVVNTGPHVIAVGSHFHFFEVNSSLVFNRNETHGYRPDIPAGSVVVLNPGVKTKIRLCSIGST